MNEVTRVMDGADVDAGTAIVALLLAEMLMWIIVIGFVTVVATMWAMLTIAIVREVGQFIDAVVDRLNQLLSWILRSPTRLTWRWRPPKRNVDRRLDEIEADLKKLR